MRSRKSKHVKELMNNISNLELSELESLFEKLNNDNFDLDRMDMKNSSDCVKNLPVTQTECRSTKASEVKSIAEKCGVNYTTKLSTCKDLLDIGRQLRNDPVEHINHESKQNNKNSDLNMLVNMIQQMSEDVKSCCSHLNIEDKINTLISKLDSYQKYEKQNEMILDKIDRMLSVLSFIPSNNSHEHQGESVPPPSPQSEDEEDKQERVPPPSPQSEDEEDKQESVSPPSPQSEDEEDKQESVSPPSPQSEDEEDKQESVPPPSPINKHDLLVSIINKIKNNDTDSKQFETNVISFLQIVGDDTKKLKTYLMQKSQDEDLAYTNVASKIRKVIERHPDWKHIVNVLQSKGQLLSPSQTAIDVLDELKDQLQVENSLIPDNQEIYENVKKCLV